MFDFVLDQQYLNSLSGSMCVDGVWYYYSFHSDMDLNMCGTQAELRYNKHVTYSHCITVPSKNRTYHYARGYQL